MKEFTIPGFVEHLAALTMAMPMAEHRALEKAAVIVEGAAKEALGTYDFGWPQLADATQKERDRLGFPANEPLLRNHELQKAIEHSATAHQATVGVKDAIVGDGSARNPVRNIGDVAVAMELGTRTAPPRSFLAQAAMRKSDDIAKAVGRTMLAHLESGKP